MTTAKPTKGPWIVSGLLSDNVTVHTMGIPSNIDPACKLQIADCFDRDSQLSWEEMNSNAKLIAEAGTVYHETSLTPRQLDDQRRELLEALETIRKSSLEHISLVDDKEKMAELIFLHNIADKTIAKVKGIL